MDRITARINQCRLQTGRFLNSRGAGTLHSLMMYRSAEHFWVSGLVCMAFGGIMAGLLYRYLWPVGAALGTFFPAALLHLSDREDNRQILKELIWLYETMIVQLESGMEIREALSESEALIGNERLRKAMHKMVARLVYGEETDTVLQEFEDSFHNKYISSFCIILRQAQESGYAVRLLSDIRLQMEELERVRLARKKEALGMQIELFQLLLFAGVMVLIIYGCFLSLTEKLRVF